VPYFCSGGRHCVLRSEPKAKLGPANFMPWQVEQLPDFARVEVQIIVALLTFGSTPLRARTPRQYGRDGLHRAERRPVEWC
jgi:hypothetical protein